MFSKALVLSLSLFTLNVSFASDLGLGAPLQDLPGSIPLKYERQASSDLMYNGKILLPDEARKLYLDAEARFQRSKNPSDRFDLSKLDPDTTSAIWKPKIDSFAHILGFTKTPGRAYYDDMKALDLQNTDDQVEYVSDTEVPIGRMAFIGQKTFAGGKIRTYQFRLDTKGHNLLLRKTLLRKLGYVIPPMDRVSTLKVKFKTEFDRSDFIKRIENLTFLESNRWVISNLDAKDLSLTLQDLIVIDRAEDSMYNLARGAITDQTIQGRRLFNALLIPYALTDPPESLNLMDPDGARIFNDQLYMPYEYADVFSTSYEDARWIARKILALTRQDWQDIVGSAKLPQEVATTLTEKLINRRNFMRVALRLGTDVPHLDAQGDTATELASNLSVSMGDRLTNGKLIGPVWTGYARHFSGVDPDSPLSRKEMLGYFKSQALSNLILNAVTEFNTRYVPHTDIGFKEFDRALDVSAKQFADFLKTKEVKPTPRHLWSTGIYDLHVVPRRDTIAGNYLGAENRVQVVDTLDLIVGFGTHFRAEGLPPKLGLSGDAKIVLMQSFSHLKPISSINAGLQEPFHNIMVPYYQHQSTLPLQSILSLDPKKTSLTDEEQTALDLKLKPEIENFNKIFGKGESVIVSESVGPDISVVLTKGVSDRASLYAKMRERFVDLSRIQIYRKDDKTVHVYFDPTLYNEFSLALGAHAFIPIAEISWSWKKGAVTTHYFSLNIDSNLKNNPDYFKNIRLVSAALKGASLNFFAKQQPQHWQLDHEFSDREFRAKFGGKYYRDNVLDRISVTHPQGSVKQYVRRTKGKRSGMDYQTLLLDVTNALVKERFPTTNLNIATTTSGNPADTLGGKAVSRQVIVEAEIPPKETGRGPLRWDNMYAGIHYGWKGWSIKKEQAELILDEIQKMYESDLFSRPTLKDTSKIQFYNIEVKVALYEQAFRYLLSLKPEQIRQIFDEHSKNIVSLGEDSQRQNPWATAVIGDLNKLREAWSLYDSDKASDRLLKILEIAESQLTFSGVKKMVGGVQNLFVRGSINGFRMGDEKGEHEISSNSLGQIGALEAEGPMSNLQRNMDISNGEFFISWLLSPL